MPNEVRHSSLLKRKGGDPSSLLLYFILTFSKFAYQLFFFSCSNASSDFKTFAIWLLKGGILFFKVSQTASKISFLFRYI